MYGRILLTSITTGGAVSVAVKDSIVPMASRADVLRLSLLKQYNVRILPEGKAPERTDVIEISPDIPLKYTKLSFQMCNCYGK